MIITFPWPPASLSGHAKGHWRAKSGPTAKTRADARMIAKAALRGRTWPADGDIPIRITFHAPNNRGDRQNYPSRVKGQLDGLADAMGINDKRFLPTFVYGENVKGGAVVIELPD